MECCFSVHGLQQLLFTDAFWSYAQQQLRRPAGMGRLAQAALSGTVPGTQPLQTMIRATYQVIDSSCSKSSGSLCLLLLWRALSHMLTCVACKPPMRLHQQSVVYCSSIDALLWPGLS